jgi:hypothetical protein
MKTVALHVHLDIHKSGSTISGLDYKNVLRRYRFSTSIPPIASRMRTSK